MTRQVQGIEPGATLQAAAQAMKSMDVGALPVCQNDQLIGVITDRDIAVRGVAQGADPTRACVSDAMTPELIYCYDDEDIQRAAQLMEQKQIRRLPVLDRNQRLIGIVALADLALRQRDDQLSAEVLQQVSQPSQPHA
jgi:CBS domain-containing protein